MGVPAPEVVVKPVEMVSISKEEYDSLLDDRKWRLALESGGVDNWEWYSESLENGGYFSDEE